MGSRLRKWAKRLAAGMVVMIAVAYAGLCAYMYAIQESLLFFPGKLPRDFHFSFDEPFTEQFIRLDDGVSLHGLLFTAAESRGVALFLGGNAGDLRLFQDHRVFLEHHYDVLAVDYRGFGKSDGTISSEAQWQADIDTVYRWLSARYDESKITVAGVSLGTGLAAAVGCRHHPRRVILISPYLSLQDMAARTFPFLPTRLLLRYPMRTDKTLPTCASPVFLLHGDNDNQIPVESSIRLQELAPKATLLRLSGDHGLLGYQRARATLGAILDDRTDTGVGRDTPDDLEPRFRDVNARPSPDGLRIAFVETTPTDVYLSVRERAGGPVQRLVRLSMTDTPPMFVWSPDGREIAVASGTAADAIGLSLQIVNTRTGDIRTLPADPAIIGPLDWQPNGASLLLARAGRGSVWADLIAVADGRRLTVPDIELGATPPYTAAFTPDGLSIVYNQTRDQASMNRDIVAVPLDGTPARTLLGGPDDEWWLGRTSGNDVVFARGTTVTANIWIAPFAGTSAGPPRRVVADTGRLWPVAVTTAARGSTLYAARPTRFVDAYTIEIDPTSGHAIGPPALVTPGDAGRGGAASWSADGQSVAWLIRGSPAWARSTPFESLSVRSIAPERRRDLRLPVRALFGPVTWSPDSRVIFVMASRSGAREDAALYRVDLSNGDATRLVDATVVDSPAPLAEASVAADGRSAVYLSAGRQVVVRDLPGGTARVVYTAAEGFQIGALSLSPDGTQVALTSVDTRARAASLVRLTISTGATRTLAHAEGQFAVTGQTAWSRDGHFIVYVKRPMRQPDELWRIASEGGEPVRVGIAMNRISHLQAHPDGRHWVFTNETPFSADTVSIGLGATDRPLP